MKLKLDPKQIEDINIRRCNAIIDEEVQITNKNLTSFDIININYTIDHIQKTSIINNTLRNDFNKHKERCNIVLDKLTIENENKRKEKQETKIIETKSINININPILIHKNYSNINNKTKQYSNIHPKNHNEDIINRSSGDKIQMLLQDQKVSN